MNARRLAALTLAVLGLTGGAFAEAAGKAVKVTPGTYTGTTSEDRAVTFKIVDRSIRSFSTTDGYNGSCGQGGGPVYTINVKKIKIGTNGKFFANVTLVGPANAFSHKGKLTGKASGSNVTGSIIDLTEQKGGGLCPTAFNEKFTAHNA